MTRVMVKGGKVGYGGFEEGHGAFLFLVREDVGKADAVDGDVDILPTGRGAVMALVALAPAIAGDANGRHD